MARLDFDPESAPKDERSFDPLPVGWYDAQIIESDLVPTNAGDGLRLKLTWEISSEPYVRRRVWQSLNIQNKSAQAQEMAQRDLRAICEAVGWQGRLEDSRDLEFKPCQIRVGVQRDDNQRNEVKTARAIGGASSPAAPAARPTPAPEQQRAPAPAAAAAGGGSRPWANKRAS